MDISIGNTDANFYLKFMFIRRSANENVNKLCFDYAYIRMHEKSRFSTQVMNYICVKRGLLFKVLFRVLITIILELVFTLLR